MCRDAKGLRLQRVSLLGGKRRLRRSLFARQLTAVDPLVPFKIGLMNGGKGEEADFGFVTATVARLGSQSKMADDYLVCPPPVSP